MSRFCVINILQIASIHVSYQSSRSLDIIKVLWGDTTTLVVDTHEDAVVMAAKLLKPVTGALPFSRDDVKKMNLILT